MTVSNKNPTVSLADFAVKAPQFAQVLYGPRPLHSRHGAVEPSLRLDSPVEIIPSRDGELKARNFDVAPQTAIEFNRLVAEQKDVDDLQPGPRLFAEALDLLVSSYDGQYDSAILSKPLGPVDYRRRKQFRLSRGRWKRLNLLIANQISGVEPRPTSRLIAEALNLLFEKYHKEPIA